MKNDKPPTDEETLFNMIQMMAALTALTVRMGGEITFDGSEILSSFDWNIELISDQAEPFRNPMVITAKRKPKKAS